MEADQGLPADLARETEMLRRIARGVLFEPALAEDAVQDAWLAALRAPHGTVTGGWLGETVKRVARGIRRRETRLAARERAAPRRDDSASAAETAERIELLRTLLTALHELDEPYRTAVRLRLLDDLLPREIAERLNVPLETVRTQVRRGIERMRAKLDVEHRARRDGRDAFLAALVPLVGADALKAGLATHAGLGTLGGVLVTAKLKWLAALVVLAALGAWWRWSAAEPANAGVAADTSVATLDVPALATDDAREAKTELRAPEDSLAATSDARTAARAAREVWHISGSALLARKTPMPGETVKLTVRRGYDDDGEVLVERELVTNEVGVFELALERPTCGVSVSVRGAKADYSVQGEDCIVARGDPAPRPLTVSYFPMDVRVRGRVFELDGTPIEGAYVDGLKKELSRTDRDGAFEERASSLSDSAWLRVWTERHQSRQISLHVEGPGEIADIEVRLERGERVHGRVVEADGMPVAGARVRASYPTRSSAITDADGRFELAGVASLPYWFQLVAELDGRTIASREFRDLELPKGEVVLRANHHRTLIGRVVDEHGAPIAAAEIQVIEPSRSDNEVVSDDNGHFELSAVRDDASRIQAVKPGFATYFGALDGSNDGSLVVVLGIGRELTGYVRDTDGKPIAGALVGPRVDSVPVEGWVRTRIDGDWTLENLAAAERLELDVSARGYARTTVLVPDDAKTLEVVLRRGAGLAGRVIDAATGEPVPRFRVRLANAERQPGDSGLGGYNTQWSDYGREFESADGRWDTAGEALEADRVTAVEIRAAGYGTRILPRVVTCIDPHAAELVIELGSARSVVGFVVEKQSGRPIAGARVQATSKREPHSQRNASRLPRSMTDATGAFRIDELPDETVRLYVEAEGFAPKLDDALEAGTAETRRTIELTRGATIRGKLLDVDGAPVANERIRLGASGRNEFPDRAWSATTDADGAFAFDAIPAGKYFVAHDRGDRAGWLLEFTQHVVAEDDSVHNVELRPPGRLTLRGELRASVPLPGNLAIQARGGSDGAEVACVAQGANFELRGLAPGRWSISATWYEGQGEHDLTGSTEIELGDGDPAPIVIELAPPRR